MGLLVDGHWQDQWYDTTSTGGRFVRQDSAFRNCVTPDGSPGPSGVGGFKAEPGRLAKPLVVNGAPAPHKKQTPILLPARAEACGAFAKSLGDAMRK